MSKARFLDIAAAFPLIAFYCFALYGFALEVRQDFGGVFTSMRAGTILASHFASALFVILQLVLLFIRKLPIAKLREITPIMVALADANSGLLYYALPRTASYPASLSAIIVAVGMLASVAVLLHLRGAFSILPQARKLVTSGPYRFVRHPLYLAEQVASFGIMLQFAQPWALLVFLLGFLLQWPRMMYEESILRKAFPEYARYANSTARIVPGLL